MIEKCSVCKNENIKENFKYCPICGDKLETAPKVSLQEQFDKDKNNELLALIITADSIINKAISMIKK